MDNHGKGPEFMQDFPAFSLESPEISPKKQKNTLQAARLAAWGKYRQ